MAGDGLLGVISAVRNRTTAAVVLGVAMLLASCSAGDGQDDSAGKTTSASTQGEESSKANAKLPEVASEFERVCNTHVGYPGAKRYEKTPGVHQVALFEDFRGEGFLASSRSLPDGWTVKDDSNFDDNSELASVELVACSDRVSEIPTGKQCEFDDGPDKVKLELVSATYQVKIYSARTGKALGSAVLEAKVAECPYIALFRKGDTKHVSEPTDDDYVNALKPYVTP